MPLSVKEVVSRFRQKEPKTVEEALVLCQVPLTFIQEGAFRRAYQVGRLPLVVKIPYFTKYQTSVEAQQSRLEVGINHSAVEVRARKRVLRSKKRFAPLHKYMPMIYHHNPTTGVVLMHKYRMEKNSGRRYEKGCEIEREVIKAMGSSQPDEGFDCDNPGNIGRDEKGKWVILDLGCFEESGWEL